MSDMGNGLLRVVYKKPHVYNVIMRLFTRASAYRKDVKQLIKAVDELLDIESVIQRRQKESGGILSREEIESWVYEQAREARDCGVSGLRRNLSILVPALRVNNILVSCINERRCQTKEEKKEIRRNTELLGEDDGHTYGIGSDRCWDELIEEFGKEDPLEL